MVSYDDYNTLWRHYQHVMRLLSIMSCLFLIVAVISVIFVALYKRELGRRRALQAQLDQYEDPAHQQAVIRMVGEASRQEMRRTAAQAQRSLAKLAKGAQQ